MANALDNAFLSTWPLPKNIGVWLTSRYGGVSQAPYATLNLAMHVGDDVAAVTENRQRLQQSIGKPLRFLNQVHGHQVVDMAEVGKDEIPTADAAVDRQGHYALAILTADCLPILLAHQTTPTVAAIHGGWRPLAGDIIAKTVEKMAVNPGEIVAYLGACIGPDAFEVGEDVRRAFLASSLKEQADTAFTAIGQAQYLADLPKLARLFLHQSGVDAVYGGEECTVLSRRYFSYRRDHTTGRMASCIWYQKEP